MSLNGSTDNERLQDLGSKVYKEQAIWTLNAYWSQLESEAENFWVYVQKHAELDQNKENGHELDEMMAHRFLESIHSTLTVREMRTKLRDSGVEKVRYVPLVHFLIIRYQLDWRYLVNAPQGSNQEEVYRCQQLLEAAQAALNEARSKESAAKQAQAELEAALRELKAQEDAYNQRTEELKQRSETGGLVSRNKAKNELAQHLAEDPLPLRRAKITQEAAVKKAEKASKAAEDARLAAEHAFQEAEAALEEAKKSDGSAQGSLWWIDRELHEAKKYMPLSKGGIARK